MKKSPDWVMKIAQLPPDEQLNLLRDTTIKPNDLAAAADRLIKASNRNQSMPLGNKVSSTVARNHVKAKEKTKS